MEKWYGFMKTKAKKISNEQTLLDLLQHGKMRMKRDTATKNDDEWSA